ncbi:hypothetical protein PAXRUDRAFT_22740, partial [Paxillus rubicundulus Ve08.2h10]
PTDTEESEDDQGGPTDEEEPSDVSPEPGAGSKHLDMGKQAIGRGLDNEGSEEEEADGRRWTQSEAVCNPKDSGAYQARNKIREKKSDGKDGREAQKPIVKPRPGRSRWDSSALPKSRQIDRPVKAKDRWLGQSQDLAWHPEPKAKMLKGYPGKVGKGRTMAWTSNGEDPNEPEECQPNSLKKALRLPW